MSVADGWDFTVPEDGTELMAELRRHGVRPGQRLHVVPVDEESGHDGGPEQTAPRRTRRLSFVGAVRAESDLSDTTDDHLRGFGRL